VKVLPFRSRREAESERGIPSVLNLGLPRLTSHHCRRCGAHLVAIPEWFEEGWIGFVLKRQCACKSDRTAE
jgi:hypothetical protein